MNGVRLSLLIVVIVGPVPFAAADDPREVMNSLGMKFVRISPGEFLMGAADDDKQADADERPQHLVCISHAFYVDQFEVTQSVYRRVMGENPSWFSPTGGGRDELRAGASDVDSGNSPVEMVSWDEAVEFCRKLAEIPEERAVGRRYRLPTEAEWECAAHAGSASSLESGYRPASGHGDFSVAVGGDNRKTHRVGSFQPNRRGLYDMQGNVWEWCSDHYDAGYYSASPTVDPQGPPSGTGRVVRGGDYRSPAASGRPSNRDFTRASRRDWGNGFRVVLILK